MGRVRTPVEAPAAEPVHTPDDAIERAPPLCIDDWLTGVPDDHHPSVLAFSALNNAAQILSSEYGDLDESDVARSRELLEEGTAQVAQLHLLLIRQERALEEQRGESQRLSRALDRVIDANSRLLTKLINVQHAAKELITLVGKPKEFRRPMPVTAEPHLEITK